MHAIEFDGLTKDYGGGRGLFDLDLHIRQGEVVGFLGPNGAGKTTTIRLLLAMIRPTRGTARVLGRDVADGSVALKGDIGYLPGELPEFGRLRCSEVVGYYEGLRRIDARARVAALCERFEIDLSRRFKELSRGNKQKMGLLLAFMHEPAVLVLDEPTAGLDPIMQHEFQRLVDEVRTTGATVFLSSHVLSEVEETCDRAAIVREGRLIDVLELDKLQELRVRRVVITYATPPRADVLHGIPGVGDIVTEGTVVRCSVRGEFAPVIDALAGTGVVGFTSHEPSLEESFFDLYRVPSSE
jgi:ABC-2 type transport system ATP-binding protein